MKKFKPMSKKELLDYLEQVGACNRAREYVRRMKRTPSQVWVAKNNSPLILAWKDWLLLQLGFEIVSLCVRSTCRMCDKERKLPENRRAVQAEKSFKVVAIEIRKRMRES